MHFESNLSCRMVLDLVDLLVLFTITWQTSKLASYFYLYRGISQYFVSFGNNQLSSGQWIYYGLWSFVLRKLNGAITACDMNDHPVYSFRLGYELL